MAYGERFAERVRRSFIGKNVAFEEKKMMGGLCFLVKDKMCVGVNRNKQGGDRLMARVGPDAYEQALARPGARPMDVTGRPMKGFVFVDAEGIDDDQDLHAWIQLALDYNPKAKSSRKRRK